MLKTKNQSFDGKVVAISGSGNVAQFAAEKVIELGGKVVTLSDSSGIIYDKNDYIDNTIENIESLLIEKKFLKKKDKYIITASMPSHWKGHTNMMKVSRVE